MKAPSTSMKSYDWIYTDQQGGRKGGIKAGRKERRKKIRKGKVKEGTNRKREDTNGAGKVSKETQRTNNIMF